jgi:D-3-phosphoglycerate dehydrogenase
MVSAPYIMPVIDRFRSTFEANEIEIITPPVKERLSEEELLNWVHDVDGVICGDDRFTERVLRATSRLKVISKWGTGIDSIDKKACERLGITICNTPNAFTDPVADTVMAYILCFSRRLLWINRDMHLGGWNKISGTSLHECTLGVIGVGHIGKAIIRRAHAFGMNLLGNDILDIPREFVEETGIQIVLIEELLRRSDFICLNCDLNPTSYHLLGSKEISLMKPSSYLINTARGPIIDEGALIKALKNGLIAGAALDVFEQEPLDENSPLRQMDNVLLAPHNANSSPEAWEKVHQNTIKNLIDVLKRSSN